MDMNAPKKEFMKCKREPTDSNDGCQNALVVVVMPIGIRDSSLEYCLGIIKSCV
jgi:hypothetical protein